MNFQIVISLCVTLGFGVFSKNVRIFGGSDADLKEFPYLVSIGTFEDETNRCSGVIISNWHIVTAAHCVANYYNFEVKIVIGSDTLRIPTEQAYRVFEIITHPEFTGEIKQTSMLQHDIAILSLNKCIRFNELQNKINLPTKNIGAVNDAIISGWGRISRTELVFAKTLQKATTNILDNSECSEKLPFPFNDEQLCTFNRTEVGLCFGDSGSPLVYNGELVGISSFIDMCSMNETPDIYTRIYSYLDFIKSILSTSKFPRCHIL